MRLAILGLLGGWLLLAGCGDGGDGGGALSALLVVSPHRDVRDDCRRDEVIIRPVR